MNRTGRAFLSVVLLFAFTAIAYGQNFPVPSKQQDTPELCPGCGTGGADGQLVGYKAPIATFVGRFLDSSGTAEIFMPVRTARANFVNVVPALDRIYFRYGDGAVAAYSLSKFFTRLDASEPLTWPSIDPTGYSLTQRSGKPEKWLPWDQWFNPELSQWHTFSGDGATRMTGFDVDDKGYVYVASTVYGWGIVKDDGQQGTGKVMSNVIQLCSDAKFCPNVWTENTGKIAVLKGATKYYAYLQSATKPVWDVTDRSHPVAIPSAKPPRYEMYAKTANADHIAVIDGQQQLSIFTADGLGGSPVYTDSGYLQITSDGTNFYGIKATATGMNIAVLVPSGGSYSVQSLTPVGTPGIKPSALAGTLHYGDGYLVLTGISDAGGWDLRLYRINANLVPQQVVLNSAPVDTTSNSYFRSYYSMAPLGFLTPNNGSYINIVDGTVYRAASGKLYLIVCARGLGDVYEIADGNSITVTNNGSVGRANVNAPTVGNGKIYYGDPISLTPRTTSSSVANVVWDFGNPEAGVAHNTQQTSSANQAMVYQFSDLTKTSLGSKQVKASSLDGTVKGAASITLEQPAARFAIAGAATKYLFAQPNASSTAPIVSGDSFVDASDGSVDSHYDVWNLDGVPTKTTPDQSFSVGACGTHTLVYTSVYGPYDPSTKVTTHYGAVADFVVGLDASNGAFAYTVKPFAAAIDFIGADPANSSNLLFRSSSRGITNPDVVAAGLKYTWEVLDAAGNSVFPGANQTDFSVPKQTFAGRPNARVRLTVSTIAAMTGACAAYSSSAALSNPINAPDPQVTPTAGDCQGTPCSFAATSISGLDPVSSGWTYKWAISPATGYDSSAVLTNSNLNITFTKTGTYSITVTATNAIGQVTSAAKTVQVNVAATPCGTLNAISFSISYSGNQGCANGIACASGESVTFMANGYQYDPNCGPHQYTWSIPGVAQAVTSTNSYTTNVSQSGTVTVTVSNGTSSKPYTTTLTVGTVQPPPPPTNPCGALGTGNIFPKVSGASCPNGGSCNANDALTFDVDPYLYDFNCATHSFFWNFGDGTTSNQKRATHSFATNGTRNVSLTVTNVTYGGSASKNLTVTINNGQDPGSGGGCGNIIKNVSLYIGYSNASFSCGPTVACPSSDPLNFTINQYQYDIGCHTHTFDWDFGDGSPHQTTKDTSHQYVPGTYHATCTVNNGSQTVTLTQDVVVSGSAVTVPVTASFAVANLGVTNGYLFTPSFDPASAVAKYTWDFGDGSGLVTRTGSAVPEAHIYADNKTYNITLTAYDASNHSVGTKTQKNEVTAAPPASKHRSVRH